MISGFIGVVSCFLLRETVLSVPKYRFNCPRVHNELILLEGKTIGFVIFHSDKESTIAFLANRRKMILKPRKVLVHACMCCVHIYDMWWCVANMANITYIYKTFIVLVKQQCSLSCQFITSVVCVLAYLLASMLLYIWCFYSALSPMQNASIHFKCAPKIHLYRFWQTDTQQTICFKEQEVLMEPWCCPCFNSVC